MKRLLLVGIATASLVAAAGSVAIAGEGQTSQTSTSSTEPPDGSVAAPGPSKFDPDGVVAAAMAGYDEFIGTYVPGEVREQSLADCPWISAGELVAAVASLGDASHLESEIQPVVQVEDIETNGSEQESASDVRLVITCDTEDYTESPDVTGPLFGVGIGVFDYSAESGELEALVEFVSSADGGAVREPSADTLGGTMYGYCEEEEDEDVPAGASGCYQFWVSGPLAVGMYVVVGPDSDTDAALTTLGDVVVAQLPGLLQRLADGVEHIDTVALPSEDTSATTDGN
jgi:hypothetical protein